MSKEPTTSNRVTREYPKLKKLGDGQYHAECPAGFTIQHLMVMKTYDAAHGLFVTAQSALGKSA